MILARNPCSRPKLLRASILKAPLTANIITPTTPFLDHTTRLSSGVMVSTAQFALAPTPYKLGDGQTAPRIGFRQQWYDFFQFQSHNPNLNSYDFNLQTAFAENRWTYHNWAFRRGF